MNTTCSLFSFGKCFFINQFYHSNFFIHIKTFTTNILNLIIITIIPNVFLHYIIVFLFYLYLLFQGRMLQKMKNPLPFCQSFSFFSFLFLKIHFFLYSLTHLFNNYQSNFQKYLITAISIKFGMNQHSFYAFYFQVEFVMQLVTYRQFFHSNPPMSFDHTMDFWKCSMYLIHTL